MLKRWILLCCSLVFLADSSLLAGGLYLESEFGTPSMGAAGAGAEAEGFVREGLPGMEQIK